MLADVCKTLKNLSRSTQLYLVCTPTGRVQNPQVLAPKSETFQCDCVFPNRNPIFSGITKKTQFDQVQRQFLATCLDSVVSHTRSFRIHVFIMFTDDFLSRRISYLTTSRNYRTKTIASARLWILFILHGFSSFRAHGVY